MTWYLVALRNYARFDGRANRLEFWVFTLFNAIIGITLQMLDGLAAQQPHYLYAVYAALVAVPSLAVGARRLHDTGRSAWWLSVVLIPVAGFIVLLALLMSRSEAGPNRYGHVPAYA